MRKTALLLVFCLIATLFAGCAGTPVVYECTCPTETVAAAPTTPAAPAVTEKPAAEGALKTGLAIVAGVGDSKSATADEAGEGKYDVTMVAVLVDDNGVIQDCVIDGVATAVQFDAKGALVTDTAVAPQTKNELGENYGMVAWGGAIAGWDAQAAAFASYITGKTAADVAGIAVNEKTAPTDADLTASVTIKIGGFQNLVAKAAQ